MSQDPKTPVSRESDKFMLRLPEGMRDHVADVAAYNRRSMNAEILARLEQTFRWDEVRHRDPDAIAVEIEHAARHLQDLIHEFQMQHVVIRPPNPPPPYVDEEEDVDLPAAPGGHTFKRGRKP